MKAYRNTAAKYILFIIGLYLIAGGVVLIIKAALGTSPISSINYVLSLNTPLTLGGCTFLVNLLLIFGQFWLIRGFGRRKDVYEILLQIPCAFVFSVFLDLNMILARSLVSTSYMMSLTLLITGCTIQAVGVVFEIKARTAMMSTEGVVKYISIRYDKDFGKVKIWFDVSFVSCAVLISLFFSRSIEGVREGSLIVAILTGYMVSFLNHKIMTRRTLQRITPSIRIIK